MKKQLLTLVMIVLTYSLFAQFSRAFNCIEEEFQSRTENIFFINDSLYQISIRPSDAENHIHITQIRDGEPGPYVSGNLSLVNTFTLNGVGVNNSEEITIAVSTSNSTIMQLNLFRLNVQTGEILQTFALPSSLKRGYIRTYQKNDSLVFYANTDVGILTRFSINIDDPTQYETEQVSTDSYDYSSQFMNTATVMLCDGDIEYFNIGKFLFKRQNTGAYSNMELVNIPTSLYSKYLVKNNDNELVLITSNYYERLDQNLNTLSSGTISGLNPIGNFYGALCFENDKYILYNANSTNSFNKIILNSSLQVESTHIINIRGGKIHHLINHNNKTYITGTLVYKCGSNSFIIEQNGILNDSPFDEYERVFYTSNQRGLIDIMGDFLRDQFTGTFGYGTRSNGVYKSIIFSAQSIIGGINSFGDTICSDLSNKYFFEVGPYVSSDLETIEFVDKNNRSYYVTTEMIENHLLSLNDPNYKMPPGIKNWRGNGDINLGEPEQILPYFDQNQNGIYEPHLGDYPKIYGDQCMAFVYHIRQYGSEQGIECHDYVYSFNCDSSEVMRNTLFNNRQYILRNESLNNIYAGVYTDFDIGKYNDDYVGTNTGLGLVYYYNYDQNDETEGGMLGFGEHAPVAGLLTLQGVSLTDDGQDNLVGIGNNEAVNGLGFDDGIVDNEFYTMVASRVYTNGITDPNSLPDLYRATQGKLNNDSYPQYAGNDVSMSHFGDTDPLHYASFGVDIGTSYSEEGLGNFGGDRRIISGTGPVDLAINDTLKLSYAYIVAHDTINAGFDERPMLFAFAQQLKNQFATNDAGCGAHFGPFISDYQVGLKELNQLEAFVYPNPVKETLHVGLKGVEMQRVALVTLDGTVVYQDAKTLTSTTIEMAGLPSGIYLLRIESAQGTVTKKVVKL